MYLLSENNFTTIITPVTNKTCIAMSLSSGRIYRGSTERILNSKRGTVKTLKRRNKQVEVEKSIYGIIASRKYVGKNVDDKIVQKMLNKLKITDSYASIKN